MDDDTIQDLKQFISDTVSQQTTIIREDIKNLDIKLSQKIDDLSASVAGAMDTSNDEFDTQFKDHELRITQLERIGR